MIVSTLSNALKEKFVTPKSTDKDTARKEYILNVLLLGLIFLAAIAFTSNLLQYLFNFATGGSSAPYVTGGVLAIFCMMLILSRYGNHKFAAYIFITVLYLIGFSLNYYYGADLPVMLLFFALVIVITGILINATAAFTVTALSGICILFFTHLQVIGKLYPNNARKLEPIHMVDSIVHVSILGIIAVVSWLFNREMHSAVKRAKESEKAYKQQRDKFEILVAERTQELKKAQVEKLMQLYRFAEFGKLSSGLFHELVAPLNLISLNLQQVRNDRTKNKMQEKIDKSIERAMLGTKRVENYLKAAKKQIQTQDLSQEFPLNEEIDNVLHMLEYKARKEHVALLFKASMNVKVFGNPLKLNQLTTNLISNGIDAYESIDRKNKSVEIGLKKVKNEVIITVQDWASGIDPAIISKIFDPLFTTKSFEKGTGIGLALCKEIVEKDFKGTILVTSKIGKGTMFTIRFPLNKQKIYSLKKQTGRKQHAGTY
jgi:signal transduction histidine kinase